MFERILHIVFSPAEPPGWRVLDGDGAWVSDPFASQELAVWEAKQLALSYEEGAHVSIFRANGALEREFMYGPEPEERDIHDPHSVRAHELSTPDVRAEGASKDGR